MKGEGFRCAFVGCDNFYLNPVFLPCGNLICKWHIDDELAATACINKTKKKIGHLNTNNINSSNNSNGQLFFDCVCCKSRHVVPPDGFKVCEEAAAMCEAYLNGDERRASSYSRIYSLKSSIDLLDKLIKDPAEFTSTKIGKVKKKIEAHRDESCAKINKVSRALIKRLEEYELKCADQVCSFQTSATKLASEAFLDGLERNCINWWRDLNSSDNNICNSNLISTKIKTRKDTHRIFSEAGKSLSDTQQTIKQIESMLMNQIECNFLQKELKIEASDFGYLEISSTVDINNQNQSQNNNTTDTNNCSNNNSNSNNNNESGTNFDAHHRSEVVSVQGEEDAVVVGDVSPENDDNNNIIDNDDEFDVIHDSEPEAMINNNEGGEEIAGGEDVGDVSISNLDWTNQLEETFGNGLQDDDDEENKNNINNENEENFGKDQVPPPPPLTPQNNTIKNENNENDDEDMFYNNSNDYENQNHNNNSNNNNSNHHFDFSATFPTISSLAASQQQQQHHHHHNHNHRQHQNQHQHNNNSSGSSSNHVFNQTTMEDGDTSLMNNNNNNNLNNTIACVGVGGEMNKNTRRYERIKRDQEKTPMPPGAFPCPHPGCPKWLSNKKQLSKHMRMHAPRVHVCLDCDKRFNRLDSLRSHQLLHSGSKSFKCEYENCGKMFFRNSDLKTHIKTVHIKNKS